MKKIFRILLVWMVLVSSLTSISVSAAPQDPDAPDQVKIYMPFVVRRVVYNVSGTITNASGNPVPGVTVTDKEGNTATSDANGHYLIATPQGDNAITAEKAGYSFTPSVLEIDVNGDTPNQDFGAAAACIAGIADPGFELGGWWILAGGAAYDNVNRNSGSWSGRTGIPAGSPNVWGYSFVRTPLINIPVGTTSAILRMWVYTESGESALSPLPSKPISEKFEGQMLDANTESPSAITAYDAQYVMVLNSSDAILEIVQWNRRNDLNWQPRQFDLSKWAGQGIKVEVGTYNDGQDFTTAMYVDDLTLTMCNDPVPPPPVCSQQIANNSFEFFGNWIDSSDAGFLYPSVRTTATANSGLHSLRVGIPFYPDVSGVNDYGYSEAYQVVAIPAGTTYAQLSFFRLLRSEEIYTPAGQTDATLDEESRIQSPTGNDLQYAYVMNFTGTQLLKRLIFEYGSDATNLQWKKNVYDLTAYAGQTVRIVFGVYNDGWNGRTTMYIDDVYLDTCTGVLPPPPPPPVACLDMIDNGSFETNSAWYIPATAYSAGYTSLGARTGFRSMRTGIYYPSHNRYSYSDFGQYVYIPPAFTPSFTATLNYWEFTAGGDVGNDTQYLLVLDYWGNWIDTLRWQHRGDYYWLPRTIDLSAYQDSVIRLHWGTYNNGWGQVTSMTIDDVSLMYCP